MSIRLRGVKWGLIGLYAAAIVLAVGLAMVLIQVIEVSRENRELRSVSETLVQQVKSLGANPIVTPPAGPQGVQGIPGPQGIQGVPGPQGIPGIQGVPGVQGIPGVLGPAGAAGPIGANGQPGIAGKDGATGPAGKDGATGPQGSPGKDGSAGPQGPAGPQGKAGKDGRTPTELECTPDGAGTFRCTPTQYQ